MKSDRNGYVVMTPKCRMLPRTFDPKIYGCILRYLESRKEHRRKALPWSELEKLGYTYEAVHLERGHK